MPVIFDTALLLRTIQYSIKYIIIVGCIQEVVRTMK